MDSNQVERLATPIQTRTARFGSGQQSLQGTATSEGGNRGNWKTKINAWQATSISKVRYLYRMRFSPDSIDGVNLVRGYARGELRINDQVIRGPVILSASELIPLAAITTVTDLTQVHAQQVLNLNPELILLGTGALQVFPGAAVAKHFSRAGVGLEAMSTGAACRTYNVLVGERRRVVALLLI
jgi:uncharacterized protein